MISGNRITRCLAVALAVFAVPVATARAAPTKHAYPWNQPDCPCAKTLHVGSPEQAGLVPRALADIDGTIKDVLKRRAAPGAVLLVARRGVIAKWKAYGYARLYKNADFDKVDKPLPMRKDEIFDMASVSKLFTATAVMQLWDEGKFKLDDPVAKYLPKFGVRGKSQVTIKQLLTHTSGFRPDPATPLYKVEGSREDRLDFVLQLPLEYPPGTHYVYSDINFLVLGALIERLSGEREDVFIRKHLTDPLHMTDTMYDPPAKLKPRIAASEYQPWTHRGLLWGRVDDENAWALDGVAGHAGVFSTAHDLAVFGQMMLNGGTYDGVRVLSQRAIKLLVTNWDTKFPDDATGLGWSIDRGYLMGALSDPKTAGHEGFTGTMIAINPDNDIVAILLTNRVHPTRHGASIVTAIRQVFTGIADAIPVNAPEGGKAWFSGYGNYLNRTLTAKLPSHEGATLTFKTWYRLEPGNDYGSVEASSDGVHWKELDLLTGNSEGWQDQQVALPVDTRYVQFRYRTDSRINGRGWYVDALRVDSNGKMATPEVTDSEWHKRDY